MACRASVAVIFSSGMAHPKIFLRDARPPGAAAGLSQQDQMLIAVAGEVTRFRRQSRLPTLIQPAIGLGVPIVEPSFVT